MPRGKSSTSADKVEARARERKALELRRRGMSYEDIADQMACSNASAHRYVMRALARLEELQEPIAKEVRLLELARLDRLLEGLWPAAEMGATESVDSVLKLMKRRADLLGLDAPKRTEVTGPEGGPVKIDVAATAREAIARAIGLANGPVSEEGVVREP